MAKLSSASIRLVQKLNRKNKNGEFPIYLVVCWKGRVEKATGVSCLTRYWDSKREAIKNGCPNAPVLNKMINEVKQRAVQRKTEFEYNNKKYTATMLIEDVVIDLSASGNDFKTLYASLCTERRLKDGSISGYDYAYTKLKEFMGKDSIIIDELTYGKLKDFASWLEKSGRKSNVIKRIMACIASVWNYAISNGVVSRDDYPFDKFKYSAKYKETAREYCLSEAQIVRIKDYWLDLVVNRNGGMWSYKDGAFDNLRKRYSLEFGLLWFIMCYKMNGSAPIELALLKPSDCERVLINNENYYSINIKRKKTGKDVHIRLKRDLVAIIGLEHFLGTSGKYVYPIIYHKEGMTDKQIVKQEQKTAVLCLIKMRKAIAQINAAIAADNALNHANEPLIDIDKFVFYTARHSFAQHYLSKPNASVAGLASLLGRSPNTIATYIATITRNEDIAEMVEDMPI